MTQASKAKMTLGLLNLSKVYTSIRNSLKAEMQNWLIADVGMKDKLSRGQGDRQFKEATGDSDADDDDGGGQAAGRRSRKGKEHAVPPELMRLSIMVTVLYVSVM
ncbi:uncharacterized protein H6S33_004911 [Morchella sextelata]|uniref:uncharacterized protein n=1 Tax=Morchella sextelata TaxID=1174677 RepID=UPI001D04C5F9|nr:uncharacterized protein H6S33_004911 [Morchella sextelata]KAH0605689.1 hypothetical protein H6S33_004911 [Morchella sextelata]